MSTMKDLIEYSVDGVTIYLKKIRGLYYYSTTKDDWSYGGKDLDEAYKEIGRIME